MFLKTANLVLYGSDLGWSCVGSLCQSSGVGAGYLFYLGALWGGLTKVVAGKFPSFNKARILFIAECRGLGVVMDAIDFHILYFAVTVI